MKGLARRAPNIPWHITYLTVFVASVPTKLAYLSVNGAGLAIAQLGSAHGVIAQEFVHASLVGSGIGDAHTGIVVGVCWWNAEGCQCHGCCRRHDQ